LPPGAHALEGLGPTALGRHAAWKVAVGEASNPLECRLGEASHPDRDRPLEGEGIEPGGGDRVVSTLEADDRVLPEPPQEIDLFFDATATVGERHSERFVLNCVPTQSNAETKPAFGEQIDLGSLFCDEGRLTLRKDQDARDELEPGRDCG
jgi:hypothetical protein